LASQPTVGATPTVVPTAAGFGGRCIFLEIFGSSIYFSKIKAEKYIKIIKLSAVGK
jgi:hypothetical protein